jgi:hypothetical protein
MIYLLSNSMYLSALVIAKPPKFYNFLFQPIIVYYTFVEPYYLMPKTIVLWTLLENIIFEWHHTNSNTFVETCY